MAGSLSIGPELDKDSQITGTICFSIPIWALGTKTHQLFLTTETDL
jgi:hypothetical protein